VLELPGGGMGGVGDYPGTTYGRPWHYNSSTCVIGEFVSVYFVFKAWRGSRKRLENSNIVSSPLA